MRLCDPTWPILFLVVFTVPGTVVTQTQGDLRLAGFFADQGSGRLELFFNNQWGTICINGFTRESANTACRQLGRSRALSFGEADELGFGQGNGIIHFSEVNCFDDSIHILHCDNDANRISQCSHGDDVGVVCSTTPAFQYNGGVRLIGGPYRSEGRLQLYFFGVWGGVCGRSFDTLATDGVCNRLGYSHSTGISYVGRANNTPVWVTSASIDCDTFTDCFSGCFRNPEEGDDLSNSCFPSEDVYISCEFTTTRSAVCLQIPADAPFVNVPNNNGESNEESSDNIAVEVVASFLGGVILLTFIIVLFTACNGVKKTKNLFEGFYECCCEGCLSVLRVLDIRRYFRHIQRNTTRSPNELGPEIGIVHIVESRPSRRSSSSSSNGSEDSYKPGGDKPPDYKHALKYCEAKEDEGYPEPSLVDDTPPPSYDTAV